MNKEQAKRGKAEQVETEALPTDETVTEKNTNEYTFSRANLQYRATLGLLKVSNATISEWETEIRTCSNNNATLQ